jgi:hypothetical protein
MHLHLHVQVHVPGGYFCEGSPWGCSSSWEVFHSPFVYLA